MITWTNLQTAMQLIIGLNIAYYAFAEIRQPVLSREATALERLSLEMARLQVNSLSRELQRLTDQLNGIRHKLDRFDSVMRIVSIVTAFVYILLLIYSSLFPDDPHAAQLPVALLVVGVGFVPPITYMIVNLSATGRKLGQLTKDRKALALRLSGMSPPGALTATA